MCHLNGGGLRKQMIVDPSSEHGRFHLPLSSSTCPDPNVLRESGLLCPLCFALSERKDRGRQKRPVLRGTKKRRYSLIVLLPSQPWRQAVARQADHRLQQCIQRNRHESSLRVASSLRCSRATPSAEKSGPRLPNRGVYRSVSLRSEKSVQGGTSAPPWGAVVDDGLRGPALCTDSASSCFHLFAST
jgi:hypothetical protein